MVGKTAPIRPWDRHRLEVIRYHIGCLPCLLMGVPDRHTTIEHITDRGRRVGGAEQHQHTIGMCNWHHFRANTHLLDPLRILGPSLAYGRTPFEQHFGSEEVLVKVTDHLVHLYDETPWQPHAIPSHVAREARDLWIELRESEGL